MKSVFRLIGAALVMIGGYYAYKAGYHLIYYDVTFGLDPGTFGYGRPYWEITIEFVFWLTVITGGIGFLTSERIGLRVGQYSLFLPILASTVLLIAMLSKKLGYSTTMLVNTEPRKMTFGEQWKFIYSEPVYFIILTFALIAVFWLTTKQLNMKDRDLNAN